MVFWFRFLVTWVRIKVAYSQWSAVGRLTWSLYLKKARKEEKSERYEPAHSHSFTQGKRWDFTFLRNSECTACSIQHLGLWHLALILKVVLRLFSDPISIYFTSHVWFTESETCAASHIVWRIEAEVFLPIKHLGQKEKLAISSLYARGKEQDKWLFKLCSATQILTHHQSKSQDSKPLEDVFDPCICSLMQGRAI